MPPPRSCNSGALQQRCTGRAIEIPDTQSKGLVYLPTPSQRSHFTGDGHTKPILKECPGFTGSFGLVGYYGAPFRIAVVWTRELRHRKEHKTRPARSRKKKEVVIIRVVWCCVQRWQPYMTNHQKMRNNSKAMVNENAKAAQFDAMFCCCMCFAFFAVFFWYHFCTHQQYSLYASRKKSETSANKKRKTCEHKVKKQ